MSLDTYANLKTELASWAARADLTTPIDTFIDLFEAWANRNLRVRQMEVEATTTATEYIEMPADYLELRDIQWQGSPRVQLTYVTPQQADEIDPDGVVGTPFHYTLIGNQIRLIPSPSEGTVRIAYWQSIPALSDAQTTNWLLTAYPDAYLYGPLMHARMFIHDPAMVGFIRDGWLAVMSEIQKAGKRSNINGPLIARSVYL
jgi:hypothetical protein